MSPTVRPPTDDELPAGGPRAELLDCFQAG
jgi:hypothetical protein